jgi:hypothetical protein
MSGGCRVGVQTANHATQLFYSKIPPTNYDQDCESFESARGYVPPALHRTSLVKAPDIDRPGLEGSLSRSHPTLSSRLLSNTLRAYQLPGW